MQISNPIANLTQIATRLHANLQALTSDDHSQYGLWTGLDANKPSSVRKGRLYYAYDTDTLYYDNGTTVSSIASAGGNVYATLNKSLTLAGLGTKLFTNLTDVASSYSGKANKVVTVNGAETGLEFDASPQPAAAYYNSTSVVYSNEVLGYTQQTTTTPTLVRTLTLPTGFPTGSVTLSWTMGNASSYSGNVASQIYKNSVAQGSAQTIVGPNSSGGFIQTITATAGDLMQLYAWIVNGGNLCNTSNLGVYGTLTIPKYSFTYS